MSIHNKHMCKNAARFKQKTSYRKINKNKNKNEWHSKKKKRKTKSAKWMHNDNIITIIIDIFCKYVECRGFFCCCCVCVHESSFSSKIVYRKVLHCICYTNSTVFLDMLVIKCLPFQNNNNNNKRNEKKELTFYVMSTAHHCCIYSILYLYFFYEFHIK